MRVSDDRARDSGAVIIAVGSELTRGRVQDTNSAWLSQGLHRSGIVVELVINVPDELSIMEQAIRNSLGLKPGLMIITGGLGPTQDDITAPAVAAALGLELELSRDALEAMAEAIGFSQPGEHHLKQATIPAGSKMLAPVGTAPGFIVNAGETVMVVLPGVPREMEVMWQQASATREVAAVTSRAELAGTLTLCLYGEGEPSVDAYLSEVLPQSSLIEASICSRFGEVEVQLDFPHDAIEAAESVIDRFEERFAGSIYSRGESIETTIVARLAKRGKSLAVAESCTGGLLAAAIVDVGGASEVFRGGIVAYHNDVKVSQLGVREEVLESAGAVSEPTAQWMAVGARSRLAADYGIGITGIAGPKGGTEEKPVGLVYICVSSTSGDVVKGFNLSGGRASIRRAAVIAALHMLFNHIEPDSVPEADTIT
jgi:nicotinamide-nucleotide amidase